MSTSAMDSKDQRIDQEREILRKEEDSKHFFASLEQERARINAATQIAHAGSKASQNIVSINSKAQSAAQIQFITNILNEAFKEFYKQDSKNGTKPARKLEVTQNAANPSEAYITSDDGINKTNLWKVKNTDEMVVLELEAAKDKNDPTFQVDALSELSVIFNAFDDKKDEEFAREAMFDNAHQDYLQNRKEDSVRSFDPLLNILLQGGVSKKIGLSRTSNASTLEDQEIANYVMAKLSEKTEGFFIFSGFTLFKQARPANVNYARATNSTSTFNPTPSSRSSVIIEELDENGKPLKQQPRTPGMSRN